MKANTAWLFLLLGPGLWIAAKERARRIRSVLGFVVTLVAALTLAEYVLGRNLGIDEILFRDPRTAVAPGRMSQATALNFLLLGLALLLLDFGWWVRLSQVAALLAAAISLLAVETYI